MRSLRFPVFFERDLFAFGDWLHNCRICRSHLCLAPARPLKICAYHPRADALSYFLNITSDCGRITLWTIAPFYLPHWCFRHVSNQFRYGLLDDILQQQAQHDASKDGTGGGQQPQQEQPQQEEQEHQPQQQPHQEQPQQEQPQQEQQQQQQKCHEAPRPPMTPSQEGEIVVVAALVSLGGSTAPAGDGDGDAGDPPSALDQATADDATEMKTKKKKGKVRIFDIFCRPPAVCPTHLTQCALLLLWGALAFSLLCVV